MAVKNKASTKTITKKKAVTLSKCQDPSPTQAGLRRSRSCLTKTAVQRRMKAGELEEPTNFNPSEGDDAQFAVTKLAETNRRLKATTKRRKIKVEEMIEGSYDESLSEYLPDPTDDETQSIISEVINENSLTGEARLTQYSCDVEATVDTVEVPIVIERGAARPPPVNSDYLPLPWRGRLGYACLNTYLRSAKTPIFSSRTCRMASIIEHRHPLRDPSQPEHPVKNRPDKSKKARKELGDKFVQDLGLANARDIIKMLKWNDKYGIKFLRLSSEMFPFASHLQHGYRLAPFASELLAEVGKVAAELGHRLTTHPGQFTQLGSPRKEVIDAAIRDLEYHDEMLTLLRLPEQQDRDAVMILHMGGVYGDKAATLDRFRKNYATLSPSIKARLVLENDDVSWSVHDLLPICEELNIPLVLDYHHHNIVFDSTQCREGTFDISQPELQERIAATWKCKGITQKMHYSEPCPGAVTPRDRRKHSPRVATLPPCPPDMDLMIEAKDKEQAVFELMRNFKLPGFEKINDMVPYERDDEPRLPVQLSRKKQKAAAHFKRKRAVSDSISDHNGASAGGDEQCQQVPGKEVPLDEVAMGGPQNRVYWPPGREDWLRPLKRGAKVPNIVETD